MRYQPDTIVIWHKRYGPTSKYIVCRVLKINSESYRVRYIADNGASVRSVLSHNIVRLAKGDEAAFYVKNEKELVNGSGA